MNFAKQVTVLFGKNGSGKSTLIHSIHKALSIFFSTDTAFEETISTGNPDLKVSNIAPSDIWYNIGNREVAQNVSLKCMGSVAQNNLDWEMTKGSTSRAGLRSTLYKKAFLSFMQVYKESDILPVFSYYSDSYPHVGTNLGKYAKDTLNSGNLLPRNFGYYQWDAETSCTSIWELRFLKVWAEMLNINGTIEVNTNRKEKLQLEIVSLKTKLPESSYSLVYEGIVNELDLVGDKIISLNAELNKLDQIIDFKKNEKSKLANEIECIKAKLIDFSKPISYQENENRSFEIKDVSVTSLFDENRIIFTFWDNREVSFDHLPQGFKRLVSIVFDISYRAFILNGVTVPSGIVLIDEIDLHLHPTLEQEVLQRFKKTFPGIQFIVTTHSPLVLTNLNQDDDNKVVKMSFNEGKYGNEDMPNLFGVDYSIGVTDIMDTPARNSTVQNLIDSIIRLKMRGKEDIAQKRYEELNSFVKGDMLKIDEEIKSRLKANQE
jgi:predicted ATP-binding protein involved in virulence